MTYTKQEIEEAIEVIEARQGCNITFLDEIIDEFGENSTHHAEQVKVIKAHKIVLSILQSLLDGKIGELSEKNYTIKHRG